MGLGIDVGSLAHLKVHDEEGAKWLREDLAAVNEVLRENNLPAHDEPEILPPFRSRAGVSSFPYSSLHHLRRAYALWRRYPGTLVRPCAAGENPAKDKAVDEITFGTMDSHPLCHSDCEGFYLPIDFREIITDERVPGAILGSSDRLFEELCAVAPVIGITLQTCQLTDAEADRINAYMLREDEFHIEQMVWIALFEASRLSREHKTAIVFG